MKPLQNLALTTWHRAPESIYIKPDVPGNNKDSLTDSEEGANLGASQTNSGNTDKSLSSQQNPESLVSSGLDNLAQSARKYIYKARCARFSQSRSRQGGVLFTRKSPIS